MIFQKKNSPLQGSIKSEKSPKESSDKTEITIEQDLKKEIL